MLKEKYNHLKSILSQHESCAIAVSGGLDSMFLAFTAHSLLSDRMMAVSVSTPYMFKSEQTNLVDQLSAYNIRFDIIQVDIPDNIKQNPENRCYLCKHQLFNKIIDHAQNKGYKTIMDGTNADDTKLHRPGLKALRELNIISPLMEAGLSKNDIRNLAQEFGYEFYDRDSNSCLLTRLPYDYPVEENELRKIEKAEEYLAELGFNQVRVRTDQGNCTIEVRPDQVESLNEHLSDKVATDFFKGLGYHKIEVDDEGYLSGKRK